MERRTIASVLSSKTLKPFQIKLRLYAHTINIYIEYIIHVCVFIYIKNLLLYVNLMICGRDPIMVVTLSTGWELDRLGKGWEGDCSQKTLLF